MDFNDITSRLERIYVSVKSKIDYDLEKNINIKTESQANSYSLMGTFDKGSIAEKENKILIIIHNLANLKDHLKQIMQSKGGDKQKIEDEIDASPALQIIIDLANSEKHTYPTRSNRSGLNPKLDEIHSFMSLSVSSPEEVSSFTFNPYGSFQATGDVGVNISADILDEHNNKIMTLDEHIEKSIIKWEEIITKYDLK